MLEEDMKPEIVGLVQNVRYGVYESAIARDMIIACEAIGIPISPEQAATLAKHSLVGRVDAYNNGIPLSDAERAIAIRLTTIWLRSRIEEEGSKFTQEHYRDCERMVNFGERGLHIGHRIGDATGCAKMVSVLLITLTGMTLGIVFFLRALLFTN